MGTIAAPLPSTGAEPSSTLSFSRQTFAKLSPHPFLLAHLQPQASTTGTSHPPVRANGRSPSTFRPPHVNTGSLTHADGSAVVRLGDTTMVCGIRGEILLAKDIPGLRVEEPNSYTGSGEESARSNSNKMRELDLLVPNIELSTGCSPAHLPGQAPSSLAQSLTSRIYSLLHGSRMLDAEELRIYHTPEKVSSSDNEDGDEMADDETEPTQQREIKAYWTLYIDILCISLDGNALDAAWASVLAALRNLKLPHAYWDIDKEAVLCDPSPALHQKLTLNGLPVASSFVVFRESEREEMSGRQVEGKGKKEKAESWILTDPDAFEESLCGERVTLVVDCESGKTRIRRIEKGGGTVIGREEMGEMVRLAEGRWREWSAVLEGLARSG